MIKSSTVWMRGKLFQLHLVVEISLVISEKLQQSSKKLNCGALETDEQ